MGLVPHSTDATSLTLLERVKAEDGPAWRRLIELYHPLVVSWCRRAGLTVEDAGDLTQEIFTTVFAHIREFHRDRSGDTFRGWLRIIGRNQIAMFFRRKRQRAPEVGSSAYAGGLQQYPDRDEDPIEIPQDDQQEEVTGLYRRALDLIRVDFQQQTWRAFWLAVVDERPTADIAGELEMTPAAVRQAKYKVLKRLRSELGELLQ